MKGRGDGGKAIPWSSQQRATPPPSSANHPGHAHPTPRRDSPFPRPREPGGAQGQLSPDSEGSAGRGARDEGRARRRGFRARGGGGGTGRCGRPQWGQGCWGTMRRCGARRSRRGRGGGAAWMWDFLRRQDLLLRGDGYSLRLCHLLPSQRNETRSPLLHPNPANGGRTPWLGPASATQPLSRSTSGCAKGGAAQLTPVCAPKWHSHPHPISTKSRT